MASTAAETDAMRRALACAVAGTRRLGPNPRVGCVLLGPDGETIATGAHHGAGTPHAEAAALTAAAEAGVSVRGATAVVTLEPCAHTGRTGPCASALIEAGVARVVYALPDPNPVAGGGADLLRAAGVEVASGLLAAEAEELNRPWLFGLAHGRPRVIWKYAATLDGRSAAADGTSRWISNSGSRADVHRLRAGCDAILAGTGTVRADDPRLTVRDAEGRDLPDQPLRAVMGTGDLPAGLRVFDDAAPTVRLRTRDPRQALEELFARGIRQVFCEGGPRIAAAFLRADLIDEAYAYLAPTMLGSGTAAIGDLGVATLAQARGWNLKDVTLMEGLAADRREPTDLRLRLVPARTESGEGAH